MFKQNWGGDHTNSNGEMQVGDKRGDQQRDRTFYVCSVPQQNLVQQWKYSISVLSNIVTVHLLLLRDPFSDRTACIEGSLSEALK